MRLQRAHLRGLAGIFTFALGVTTASVAGQERGTLTLDREEYAPGQDGTLRMTLPAAVRDEGYVFINVRPAGSGEKGEWMKVCGWPIANGADRPCAWTAPAEAGEYEVYAASVIRGTVVATATFRVRSPAGPAPPATPPSTGVAGPSRSARGRIRLRDPNASLVVGETFEVVVTVPPARPEAAGDTNVSWIPNSEAAWDVKQATTASSAPGPARVPDAKGGGSFSVRVTAPWQQPGRYDLRLMTDGILLDVLPLRVGLGRTAGALTVDKSAYVTSEPVSFSAVLPENRFYHMGNGGPSVIAWPVEREGRRLSVAEQAEAWRLCDSCQAQYLEDIAVEKPSTEAQPPFGGRPGRYRARMNAPSDPGRYELRLTDRPYLAVAPGTVYEFAFASSREFVVEAPGTSPSSLRFVRVRPPSNGGLPGASTRAGAPAETAYEELRQLTHGEPFFVEARFQSAAGRADLAERQVTLEWVDRGVNQSRIVTVARKAPGLYLSGPIVLEAPRGGR